MVTVTSATSTLPTVFPLIQCGSGTADTVTLGCLAIGFTPSSLTYSWSIKNGDALTDFIQYPAVQKGNHYSAVSQIQVSKQDFAEKVFQCKATNTAGSGQAMVTPPEVFCKDPTLKVLAFSDEETEASFTCFAKDFSPKDYEIKWLKNEAEISNKISEISVLSGKSNNGTTELHSATSILTVSYSEWIDSKFTCEFRGKCKNNSTLVKSTVTYKSTPGPGGEGCPEADVEVKIIGPKMEDMFSHSTGFVKCQVTVNKPSVEKISWEDEHGNPVADASFIPSRGSRGPISASLPITYDEWSQGKKFICRVEHNDWIEDLLKKYERITGGPTQRPSVFMQPPLEHTRDKMVTLTCYVKDFFPKEVVVSWLVDDEIADSKYKFHTTNPVENGGSYSAYGQLSLSLDQWENNDTVYSCVVYHESVVNKTKAIVRSIGHRTFEKINLVNLNMNIPETCKAL